MFDPFGSDNPNEFVEIYNFSHSQIIDLTGWKITDSVGVDNIVSASEGLLLFPGQFAVLLESDYSIVGGLYESLVPDTARIVKISTSDFGSGGLRNSPPETLYLVSASNDTIAAYRYSGGSPAGYSDEKITLSEDNSGANWTSSKYVHGTPGAPPTTDLQVQNILFNPAFPPTGTTVEVVSVIKNTGVSAVQSFWTVLFRDSNRNFIAEDGESIDSTLSLLDPPLLPGDTTNVSMASDTLSSGFHHFISVVRPLTVLPFADTITANNVKADSVQTQPAMDLAVVQISALPMDVITHDSVRIQTVVANVGLTDASSFHVLFFEDHNLNGIPEASERIDSFLVTDNLSIGDSLDIQTIIHDIPSGVHYYMVLIEAATVSPLSDENELNNQAIDSLSVSAAVRLSMKQILFSKNPKAGLPWETTAIVRNDGPKTVTAFRLHLFLDADKNAIGVPAELLDSIDFSGSLTAGDSTYLATNLVIPDSGVHYFIAQLLSDAVAPYDDESAEDNEIRDSVRILLPDSITITEVMFDPDGTDNPNEFVELYNYSKTRITDLSGWKISDSTGADNLTGANEGLLLYPGQYAVIFEGDYDIVNGLYASIVADTARILKIEGTTIGATDLRNTLSEPVLLITNYGDTISAYRYSTTGSGQDGYSDEKIDATAGDSPENWTNSLNLNGTPGAPPTTDLRLQSINTDPIQPSDRQPFVVKATVLNSGILAVESFIYRLYADTNRNGDIESFELIDSQNVNADVLMGDSIEVSSVINGILGGEILVRAVIHAPADTAAGNDTLTSTWNILFAYDLAVVKPALSYGSPQEGKPIVVSVTVRNTGTQAISGHRLVVQDELLADVVDSIVVMDQLDPSDSVDVQFTLPSRPHGRHFWRIQSSAGALLPSTDQNATNDTARISFDVSPIRHSVIVNEINYQPADTSTEWIEVFNRGSETFDLQKWKVSDGNSDQNGLGSIRTITAYSYPVAPGEFLVIAKDSLLFRRYYGNSPAKALYVSNLPALNNDGDIVAILDSSGNIIDSLRYLSSWGGGLNNSLERLFPDSSSISKDNWVGSSAVLGGTPGSTNTAVPPSIDLGIESVQIIPQHPVRGQVFTAKASIRNFGLIPSPSYNVSLKRIVTDTVELDEIALPSLLPGYTTVIEISDTAISELQKFLAMIHVSGDERPTNNVLAQVVVLRTAPGAVIINEINYLPSTGFSEWLELFNRSSDTVNLRKWRISDEASVQSPKIITDNPVKLPPSAFVVLVRDSIQLANQFPDPVNMIIMPALPSLNNSGDQLIIVDSTGSTVDSVFYESSWGGGENKSLERVSPDSLSNLRSNWRSSSGAFGGTPGVVNSSTPLPYDVGITPSDLRVHPMFPVPGDTVYIHATIRNIGLLSLTGQVVARLYEDVNGDLLGTSNELIDSSLITSMPAGDSAEVFFTYTVPVALGKLAKPSGIKTIIFQLDYPFDQRPENGTVYFELPIGTRSQTIVINEILFQPDGSTTEFVEIYNTSTQPVNLEGFKVADASSSKIIATSPVFLPGLSYRVLTGDTALASLFGTPDSLVIVVPGMPSLGNSEDAVVIMDDLLHRVDSVYYFASWGGGNGKSLERISSTKPAIDPGNWTTAVVSTKATPGVANSAPLAEPFARNQVVINEIMFSPFTGEPEYIELFNPGNTAVNLLNWSVQVGNDKSILVVDNRNLDGGAFLVLSDESTLPARFSHLTDEIMVPEDGLPTLSNEGARVILRDWVGTVIDSVDYNYSWGGGPGISLERRLPQNDASQAASWGSCVFVEGGTPGDINSIYTGTLAKKIRVKADPNPFFVDDGQEAVIQIDLPVISARLNVKIYDNQGRLITTLLNNSLSGNHREVRWNGRDSAGRTARLGIYIIFVEAIEELGGFRKSAKAVVVLGRRL